ncbi:MAG TPA: DUF1614 domain-containing protein [Streptosporangiaceae bacterium]
MSRPPLVHWQLARPFLLAVVLAAVLEVALRWRSPGSPTWAARWARSSARTSPTLPKVRRLGAPVASIGGAGTFDGVFLTGVIAVLLAGLA